tara:strand:- start:2113 stop:2307 length:195 start_codon:yes stop_codon:yes gene_type:complete
MPYTYEYLTNEEQIALIQAKLKNSEERMLELELADQDDVGIQADIADITQTIATLKAKLTELQA